MRILVVSDLYPPAVRGGYEVECHDVVEHLRERHEVTVLTSVSERDACPPEAHVLRWLPWTGEGSRREVLSAAPDSIRAMRATRRALAAVEPDAIYLWNAGGLPAAGVRVLQEHPRPLLVRVCEYWFTRLYSNDQFTSWLAPGRTGVRGAWSLAMRAANRLPGLRVELARAYPAAVSWNAEYVREHAPAPPAFTVVHGDITIPSNARTRELADVPRAPQPGRVLFVGRLEAAKGAHVVVRALAVLRDRHGMAATLHVVGNGTEAERAELAGLAARLGLAERVVLTGPLRGDALIGEIAAASAWCVPSVWDEPAPLTCVEAALSGVPAVLSRVGGIPEVLHPGTHALFHERDDPEGCAAALAEVLAGGPEVDARVVRAAARAAEFSFEPYLARMDRFLDEGLRALGVT